MKSLKYFLNVLQFLKRGFFNYFVVRSLIFFQILIFKDFLPKDLLKFFSNFIHYTPLFYHKFKTLFIIIRISIGRSCLMFAYGKQFVKIYIFGCQCHFGLGFVVVFLSFEICIFLCVCVWESECVCAFYLCCLRS